MGDPYEILLTLLTGLDPTARGDLFRELTGRGLASLSGEDRARLRAARVGIGDALPQVAQGMLHALARGEESREGPGLVWTGPASIPPPFPPLTDVVPRLIRSAQERLLIVSYSLSFGAAIWDALGALPPGVQVHIIGHDLASNPAWQDHVERAFGAGLGRLHLYTFRPEGPRDWRKLHAKLLVIDDARCLVGSANFTQLGFYENIEIGAELGPRQARQLWALFKGLVTEGILEAHG